MLVWKLGDKTQVLPQSGQREPGPGDTAFGSGKLTVGFCTEQNASFFFNPNPRISLLMIREAGKHGHERETSASCLQCTPRLGNKPTTQVGVLTGDPTQNF